MLDPDGLPLSVLRNPDGTPVQITLALPDDAQPARPHLEGVGRPHHAAAARHRHPREHRRAAHGHRPSLRRRRRAPPAAGAAARHRRRPRGAGIHRAQRHTRARRVPHERGARRIPRPRAHRHLHRRGAHVRRGAAARARGHGVHDAHARSRGHRPVRSRHSSSGTSPARCCPASSRPTRSPSASSPVPTRRRAPSTWRSWACGSPGTRTASRSCTARSAGACSATSGRGSTPTRCRSPRSPTACTRRRGPTPPCSASPESTLGTGDTEHADWGSPALSDGEFWNVKRRMRLQLVEDARRRLAEAWSEQRSGAAAPAWISKVLDPDTLTVGFARRVPTYKRLTLMLQRPRAAEVDPHQPRAAGAVRDRRQVASRRRRGQATHPAARAVRAAARTARPHRVPPRLRHRHGVGAVSRAATSGSTTRCARSRRAAHRA